MMQVSVGRWMISLVCATVAWPAAAATFKVRAADGVGPEAASGRLVVFVIADASLKKEDGSGGPLNPKTLPLDGPLWDSAEPIFATDVRGLKRGEAAEVNDSAEWLVAKPSELAPGTYRAQALLITRRNNSSWRREAGNLYSSTPVSFEVKQPGAEPRVEIVLDTVTTAQVRAEAAEIEWYSTLSTSLTAYRGRPIMMRAGVLFPKNYDPSRKYPTIYFVPGFGGDDTYVERLKAGRDRSKDPAEKELAENSFTIVLDPESPNGHTLFADSENNGPCGRALVEELIPALESKFPLIAKPEARLLRGHSSGGWSTLWLALQYPQTFGAAWSTSPDPVDFRKFQLVNIYEDENFYQSRGKDGTLNEWPSFRRTSRDSGQSKEIMTVRRECRQEDMLGADNSSGQQYDSWCAVAGPRNERGRPAALFDPVTGVIDRAVAEKYRAYDIGEIVRKQPQKYLPILKERVRLICGDADSFYLNEAVRLFVHDVAKLDGQEIAADATAPLKWTPTGGGFGSIVLLPGYDHGTVFGAPEVRAFPKEMLEYLRAKGVLK
ncbi:MAG: esterase family protein [Phycisphaerales bacterium]|nr:esterase family protein [Phycisphaerales bacterium]